MKRATTVLRTKSNARKARSVVQSIRLSRAERSELRALARSHGMSVSDWVRRALVSFREGKLT